MRPDRENSRGKLRLGKKSARLLSALFVLIFILVVVLILYEHVTPAEGPHIMP